MDKVREQFDSIDDTWSGPSKIGVGIHRKDTLVTNRGKVTPTRSPE
jgi:hypothetical protein